MSEICTACDVPFKDGDQVLDTDIYTSDLLFEGVRQKSQEEEAIYAERLSRAKDRLKDKSTKDNNGGHPQIDQDNSKNNRPG